MKFSDIRKGNRARETVELPRFQGQPDDAPKLTAHVRALNGLEEEAALEAAVKRAKEKGANRCEPGDPIYDLALMVETIAVSYTDPDSPEDEPKRFFDGGPEQVRQHFGREAIALLYDLQQAFQEKSSPTIRRLGAEKFFETMQVLGGEDERAAFDHFLQLGPVLQWSCARFGAVQHVTSLRHKLELGSSESADS